MKRILLTGCALLVAGCSVPAERPAYLAEDLDRAFAGHPVSQFFASYGPPFGDFTLPDGTHAYRWNSVRRKHPEPLVSTYMTPEGREQIADTYQGATETTYCELRVYTNRQGIIGGFAVAVDTGGKWGASRCSEIFEPPTLYNGGHA